MKELLLMISLVVFIIIMGVVGFKTYRWFNWSFGYESKVIETIHSEVKMECLRSKGG